MTTTTDRPTTSGTTHLTRLSERELRIERVFDASRDRVWRAYTDPAHVAQWWGRGNPLVIERMEVERGGHWRYVEHVPDGGAHGFEGRYREVTPQERISRTFEWDGMPGHVIIETTSFEEIDASHTRVIATSTFIVAEDLEGMVSSGMEKGMNESYAALDALLASAP